MRQVKVVVPVGVVMEVHELDWITDARVAETARTIVGLRLEGLFRRPQGLRWEAGEGKVV